MDSRVIYRNCTDCGDEFSISVGFQKFLNDSDMKLPKRCKKCRDIRKSTVKECECVECGQPFGISANEAKFYKERGLHEPKRCEKCRKGNNGQNAEADK